MAKNFERLAIAPSTVSAPPGSAGLTQPNTELPTPAQYIQINPSLAPLFASDPSLKRTLQYAIDSAVAEIINPVVERSVTIAGIATQELVVKDFALEPSAESMRQAAHHMVAALSGSLAGVTCREPLRIAIITHLKARLADTAEQAIFLMAADNLVFYLVIQDLACSLVEKSASEKAIVEIDASLATDFENRRKHRERTGQPFYDLAVYSSSRYPSTLPESLRLRPGGLTAAQVRVYEDFTRVSGLVDKQQPEEPLSIGVAVEKFTVCFF